MSNAKYSYQGEKEGIARAFARGLRISYKEAYEATNALRGRKLVKARQFLTDVLAGKQAIPYKKYNHGVPHRPGMGPGRYPKNTTEAMLKLLSEVESNAEARGLNTGLLEINHIAMQKARPLNGNFKGSQQQSPTVHIEIVVREGKETDVKKEEVVAKEEKKEEKPKTAKPEEPKPDNVQTSKSKTGQVLKPEKPDKLQEVKS
jgi:large subunit ribosomal protein L22